MDFIEVHHSLSDERRGRSQSTQAFLNEGGQSLLTLGLDPSNTPVPTVFQQPSNPCVEFLFKELNFGLNGFNG